MNSEMYLLSVYQLSGADEMDDDAAAANETGGVLFEAYSFDTSETHSVTFEVTEFDALFRFNPNLMNPNHREDRYSWCCNRLYFAADGNGGRTLACSQMGDTVDKSHLCQNTNADIPMGRTDYESRIALRNNMNFLQKKRSAAIADKEQHRARNFITIVMERKVAAEAAKQQRLARILEEKKTRAIRSYQQQINKQYDLAENLYKDHMRKENIRLKNSRGDAQREVDLNKRVQSIAEQVVERREKLDGAQSGARDSRRDGYMQKKNEIANLCALEKTREQALAQRFQKLHTRDQQRLFDRGNAMESIERNKRAIDETKTVMLAEQKRQCQTRVVERRQREETLKGVFSWQARTSEDEEIKSTDEKALSLHLSDSQDQSELPNRTQLVDVQEKRDREIAKRDAERAKAERGIADVKKKSAYEMAEGEELRRHRRCAARKAKSVDINPYGSLDFHRAEALSKTFHESAA